MVNGLSYPFGLVLHHLADDSNHHPWNRRMFMARIIFPSLLNLQEKIGVLGRARTPFRLADG